MYVPVELLEFLPPGEYFVSQNGKLLNDVKEINADCHYEVHLRLRGGKGGTIIDFLYSKFELKTLWERKNFDRVEIF